MFARVGNGRRGGDELRPGQMWRRLVPASGCVLRRRDGALPGAAQRRGEAHGVGGRAARSGTAGRGVRPPAAGHQVAQRTRAGRAALDGGALVEGTHAAQAAQNAGHLRAEDATVGMRLVDDHVLEMAEEFGPQWMVGQNAHVKHVRIGDEHARPLADPAARRLGRVAVIGGRLGIQQGAIRRAGCLGSGQERLPLAQLILGERFGRIEIEGPRQRIVRQRLHDRDVETEGLAAGGGGGDHHVVTGQGRADRGGLVSEQTLDPGGPQGGGDRRAQALLEGSVTRGTGGHQVGIDQLV